MVGIAFPCLAVILEAFYITSPVEITMGIKQCLGSPVGMGKHKPGFSILRLQFKKDGGADLLLVFADAFALNQGIFFKPYDLHFIMIACVKPEFIHESGFGSGNCIFGPP